MDFKPGDRVLFYYDNKRHYKTIKSIIMTAEGLKAKFDPGCACKVLTVPVDILFKSTEDFLEYLKEKGVV